MIVRLVGSKYARGFRCGIEWWMWMDGGWEFIGVLKTKNAPLDRSAVRFFFFRQDHIQMRKGAVFAPL